MDDGRQIPRVRGRVLDVLREAKGRVTQYTEMLEVTPVPGQMSLMDPQERGVVALALAVLEQLREVGGVQVSETTTHSALEKFTRALSEEDLKAVEVEAYGVFAWLGEHLLGPEPVPDTPERISPDAPHEVVVRWAMLQGRDLLLSFYDVAKGSVHTHEITPIRIEAQTYLVAFCHDLGDEKSFRLSRIGSLSPVEGWDAYRLETMPDVEDVPLEAYDRRGAQMTMFLSEEE